jgi:hypothetical protein
MRLLAADLILAADEQRQAHAADLDGELAKLVRLGRFSGGAR